MLVNHHLSVVHGVLWFSMVMKDKKILHGHIPTAGKQKVVKGNARDAMS